MRIWNKLFVAQAIGRSQRTPFKANTPESKRLKKTGDEMALKKVDIKASSQNKITNFLNTKRNF